MMSEGEAKEEGRQAGHAAATWVEIDDVANARAILAGYEDGDPKVMDMQPAPLSGEWAGGSLSELGLADASEEALDAYEEAYSGAYWAEIVRAATAILPERPVPPANTSTGWICSDCLMLMANGETPVDWTEEQTEEWLAEIRRREEGSGSVTLGMFQGAPECDCTDEQIEAHDYEAHSYCEEDDFSWRQCDSCGSTLGGSRHAATWWFAEEEEDAVQS